MPSSSWPNTPKNWTKEQTMGPKKPDPNPPKLGFDKSSKEYPAASFKKGGKVKKTATYRLHKGEKVIPAPKKKKR